MSSYWYIPYMNPVFDSSRQEDDESIATSTTNFTEEYADSIIYDSEYEDQDDDIIHRMYLEDREFNSQYKYDHAHYLGTCSTIESRWTLDMVISPNLFFSHTYRQVCKYLTDYSFPKTRIRVVEIMQLNVVAATPMWTYYFVVLKTHWIRLIQRHWRKVCKHNKFIIMCKKSPILQRHREIHGKYPIGFNRGLGIQGLMWEYGREAREARLLAKCEQI
jgi:hypothetical protein